MSPFSTQRVDNRGDNNVLHVAGGDIRYEQNVFTQAPDFFEPNLRYVEPPNFESPGIAGELTVSLLRHQILILGGSLQEKSTLAHHLAWCLRQQLEADGSSPNGGCISIQEWIQHSGPARIQTALRGGKSRTLFILPQIQPHQVEHDPGKLGIDARKSGHYILATTDVPRDRWVNGSRENLEPIWRELATATVYPPRYLGHFLRKELDRADEPLPEDLFPDGHPRAFDADLERCRIGDLTFLEAARRLGTPDRIRALAQWLTALSATPPGAARLQQYIEHLEGDQTAIAGWYRKLDHRQQLLALGLAMLDGLLDDQLFAALEILVEKVWRPRDPSLASFDYHDLEALSGYFRRTSTQAGGIKVECNSDEQRQALLNVAWGLHRRQIIAAIPMLTEVVKAGGDEFSDPGEKRQGRARKLGQVASEATENLQQSERHEDEKESDAEAAAVEGAGAGRRDDLYISRWRGYGPASELYGSRHRQQRFFAAVSDFLSHLGLLSPETVERCCLELASNPFRDVQVVAAKAMAKWREHEEHEQLFFSTLHHWQNEAATKERIVRLFSGRRGFPPSPYANVRATISLAVSYASLYDPPNKLSPQLRRLLDKLARDRHPVVRTRLRDQTLPLAVARHRRQLDPTLKELARYTDLMSSIAFGWALACQADLEGSWELLDAWFRASRDEPATPHRAKATVREAKLAVVALTYGYLDYQVSPASVSVEHASQRLGEILEEKHPFLRRRVLQAMVLQTGRSLRSIDRQIRELLQSVGLEERDLLLKPLEQIYLDQRFGLDGGDEEILIDGRFYSVWASGERPRTEVEEVLREWLDDGEHPVAQQVAFDALTRFKSSKVDREELRWREENGEESPAESEEIEVDANDGPIQALRPTAWIDRLAITMITLGDFRARVRLKALVAELREQVRQHGVESERLVDELRDAGAGSGDLGRDLKRYLVYHRYRSAFHAGAIIAALLLLLIPLLL